MITKKEMEVAKGARRVLGRAFAQLNREFPEGDYENSPYFQNELRHFLTVLNDLATYKHRFGKYLITNGYSGQRFVNVGTDLFISFCDFLINGSPSDDSPERLENRIRNRDEYRNGYETDENINFEHLAIYEMIGTYVKRIKPGIEKYYYS